MQRNNTKLYAIAFLLFAAGVGYLAYSGFAENSVYFLNVAEARAMQPEKLSAVRLFGTVAEKDLEQGSLSANFLLEDKDNASLTIAVRYAGVVPDTFKVGAEVIVEGGMDASGHFSAKSLMTKCPSKYQKENRKG